MDYLRITYDALDVGFINSLAAENNCGAISLFVGTTRDTFEGKKVLSLEYECYKPMAEKEFRKICKDIRGLFPNIVNIVIHHRIGLVPVGEASVIVALSSPHRRCSLEALPIVVNHLKSKVPIWKKERYENDECKSKWKSRTCLKVDAFTISNPINENLIQINAGVDQVQKRIQSFIKQKRQTLDEANIPDFTSENDNVNGNKSDTCARTRNSILIKRHLKVQKVENSSGPQTNKNPVYSKVINNLSTNANRMFESSFGNDLSNTEERIKNVEIYLGMESNSSIISRLKAIEDRLLLLETISPEYKHFINQESTSKPNNAANLITNLPKRRKYTVEHINVLINDIT